MRRGLSIALCVGLLSSAPAIARAADPDREAASPPATPAGAPAETGRPTAPPKPMSMSELLDLVLQGFEKETKENKAREQAFLRAKEDQQRMLDETLAQLHQEEEISQHLEETFSQNDSNLATAQADLAERLGQLGEIFGVVRQVATDLSGEIFDSLISSQIHGRQGLLDRLGRSTELPSTQDMERLWFELQRDMVEQGRVVRYLTPVLTTDGEEKKLEVVRAGPFTAFAGDGFLLWEPSQQKLRQLTRQPPTRYVETISSFEAAPPGIATLALDPSRGQLLNSLIDTPSRTERIQQGGAVGYVIIVIGVVALVLGFARWVVVGITSRRVAAQRKKDHADSDNPLGRVLKAYEDNPDLDTESLELTLDEVVLRESSRLERFLWLVKVASVVAPLLGLLGTVTGMIKTFQAITLFGAGDPRMMAGGISEALVTTMLGLMTAIPLVLLHAAVSNSSGRIIDILEEQSAGLIARQARKANAAP